MLSIFIFAVMLGLVISMFPSTQKLCEPVFGIEKYTKRDCSSGKIKCIDTCEFICTSNAYDCIKNVCRSQKPTIACENGGMLVMVDGTWKCICRWNHVYDGARCETRNPKFCEEGYVYENNKCACPYVKLTIHNFTYCTRDGRKYKPVEFDDEC